MRTCIVAFIVAMAMAALLTPLVCRFAHRFGWLDSPGVRKVHKRAVPRLGGVAVVAAFFTPIFGLALLEHWVSEELYADLRLVTGLFGGAAGIVALGIYDDIKGAGARLKLLVQISVAVALWLVGFRIELLNNPLGDVLHVGVFSLPLTILWMVGIVNAMNLIDGLDGLASGVALLASIVLFGVAFVGESYLLCLFMASLGGSLVGFLFWNFNPAKIFLGDSGSMFLGFVLASASIWTQQKGATFVALLVPVLALGLPILDTALSFVRRLGQGRSPFEADREHLHHRLMALGLSHRNAVLTLYTASIVFGLAALVLLDNDAIHRAVALSTAVVVAVILVRKVGVFSRPGIAAVRLPAADRAVIRRTVRAVRKARGADEAWEHLMPAFPELSALAARLTWIRESRSGTSEPGEAAGVRRAAVYFWRSDAQVDWPLDRAEVHPGARVLALESEGETLGELVLLFEGGYETRSDLRLSVHLELLAEALIEYREHKAWAPENVVPLVEARRSQTNHR